MPTPGEHKTVQARILAYAKAVGWTFVSQKEAEQRRGFDPETPIKDRAKGCTLFFEDLLDTKVREFNPRYAEAEGALPGKFPPSPRLWRTGRHLHTDIYGNREFVEGRPLPRHHPHSPSGTDDREDPGKSLQTFLTAENAKSTKNLEIHPFAISALIAIQPPSAKQIFR
jgi:hypothetical protein